MTNRGEIPTPRTDMFVARYLPANYQIGSDEATDVIIGELTDMELEIADLKLTIKSMREINHD